MAKKILILILALPLFLMISIFTTSNTVSSVISIPVTGLDIIGSNIIYLDLDNEEKYEVNYTVYPTNANQNVVFTTEEFGDSKLADLEYRDGYIIPKSVGAAKVFLTTVDGGYKDSFVVYVYSDTVQAIEAKVETSKIYVGQTTKIEVSFIPRDAKDKLISYTSSNENVLVVDDNGTVRGVGKGQAVITVQSINNPSVNAEVPISVLTDDILSLGNSEIYTWDKEGTLNLTIDSLVSYELSYQAYYNSVLSDEILVSFTEPDENGNLKANFAFKNQDFIGDVTIEITIKTELGLISSESCIIHKTNDIMISFENQVQSYTEGSSNWLTFSLNPSNANVNISVLTKNVDNDNESDIISATVVGKRIMLVANKPGVCVLELTVTNKNNPEESKTITTEVVVTPRAIAISESAKTYGIEGIKTIGGLNSPGFSLTPVLGSEVDSEILKYVSFESSDSENVSIDKNGLISINDSQFEGLIDFYCVFSYKNVVVKSAPYKMRVIGQGVNVDNYLDLLKAVNNGQKVVLQKSIHDDFGYDENGKVVYSEIQSTYDYQYYVNTLNGDKAKIKILLNIKNDIYGNGYEINANNIANGLDSNGQLKNNALFRGPLNFVSLTGEGTSAINVKGQDNVAFAIYENVTLNNVSLKSCDLQADSNGIVDLVDLNYVGTTVEVFGDNVNIEYSRIANGRTTMRVFGDIKDAQKAIHVNIENSVLSGAREFVIRIGSNAFVNGTIETPAPKLPNDPLTQYPAQLTYKNMTESEKEAYDQAFIKTFVNIKNSVLKDSGIFVIGMDSHFSGPALADGDAIAKDMTKGTWHDLAKTSYGAKLTFEEEVRIYDWKKLDMVDSSSLIEVMDELNNFGFDMSFDVKEMVEAISSNEKFKDIVSIYNNEKYVHGGIAFFGGGKNYNVCDFINYSFYDLNGYQVSLDEVNKGVLKLAAGEEPFYFLLHDATTYFTPEKQESLLQSGDAYSFIYKK